MTQEMQATPADAGTGTEGATKIKKATQRTTRPRHNPKATTKSDAVIGLLSRCQGATLDDMMKVTGWQAHSVRGFLAGTLKKKIGHAITSEKTDKGRVYRIAAEAQ